MLIYTIVGFIVGCNWGWGLKGFVGLCCFWFGHFNPDWYKFKLGRKNEHIKSNESRGN